MHVHIRNPVLTETSTQPDISESWDDQHAICGTGYSTDVKYFKIQK